MRAKFIAENHLENAVRDLVIALGVCSSGNFAKQYGLPGEFAPIADFKLAKLAAEECEKSFDSLIGTALEVAAKIS